MFLSCLKHDTFVHGQDRLLLETQLSCTNVVGEEIGKEVVKDIFLAMVDVKVQLSKQLVTRLLLVSFEVDNIMLVVLLQVGFDTLCLDTTNSILGTH